MSGVLNGAKRGNDGTGMDCSATGPACLRERVRQATREIESEIIMAALAQHRWNRRRTAEALNISYRSLMYKMKNCNVRENAAARPPAAN